ncbi:MAG: acetate kinase [Synechococcus sp.]
MKILVLNAGSSSQKSCLYELPSDGLPPSPPSPVWEAHIDWTVAADGGAMTVKANGAVLKLALADGERDDAIPRLLETLVSGDTQVLQQLSEIDTVGHRVVHGGAEYSEATAVSEDVKAAISRLTVLAPAHNPANLAGIEAIEQALGDVPQVAVFDTAFHSHMPKEAAAYPIPYEWYNQGIRRYGFHGISHRYCSGRAADLLGKPLESLKLVTCHLGNGCSLSAVCDGCSIDTTMGFTPLEGLMMGTRSGSIDPAIPIHLMREYGLDANRLDALLNKESGLKGVSGVSADLRTVLEAIERGSDRAQLAFDMFIHRLRSSIGSMVASLEGVDAIVFTAGIGENSPIVRQQACAGFEFLGLQLDEEKNNSSPVDCDISAADSAVRVLVVRTEEDWAIAQACWQLQSSNVVELSR